jgi:hypothetical protein
MVFQRPWADSLAGVRGAAAAAAARATQRESRDVRMGYTIAPGAID